MPLKLAGRFSMKARVPSALSSVENASAWEYRSKYSPDSKSVFAPTLMAILANITATGPLALILPAISKAASNTVPSSTTFSIRPIRSASSAER